MPAHEGTFFLQGGRYRLAPQGIEFGEVTVQGRRMENEKPG
jgi:hypothetical protein